MLRNRENWDNCRKLDKIWKLEKIFENWVNLGENEKIGKLEKL